MDTLVYVTRMLHYAAALQLFGATTFQAWMAPAGLRQELHVPLRRLTIACAWLTLGSGVLWLLATAAGMGDGWQDATDPEFLGIVLSATGFGRVWTVRLVIMVALVIGVTVWRTSRDWRWLDLLSVLTLGSLGFIGHAAAEGGAIGVLHQTSQVLHLLGSGFWVGSLLPLVLSLQAFRSPAFAGDADMALRRFSGLGHLAVAIAIGTGVANTWFILRAAEIDITEPYQSLLLAKVIIVGIMIGLALVNRYAFVPRIPNDGPGVRQLRDGTIAEIFLTVGIVVIIGVLGVLPPS